jgi:hypothetical protein
VTSATQQDRRKDYYYSPGARLDFPDVYNLVDVVTLRYIFEHNISNEPDKQYASHIFGIYLTWRVF